jgi:hypothetical protein
LAQQPSVAGTWSGTVIQNSGTAYSVTMTIHAKTGETEYPELKCGGKLAQIATTKGYVFYTEEITHGGQGSGGGCINGTITVRRTGDKLNWGWMGSFEGKTFSAWSVLSRK